jgi:curved DNA-binding protein CbpA
MHEFDGLTADEAKARYRKLATLYHPDSKGGSTEQMQKLEEAYDQYKKANGVS